MTYQAHPPDDAGPENIPAGSEYCDIHELEFEILEKHSILVVYEVMILLSVEWKTAANVGEASELSVSISRRKKASKSKTIPQPPSFHRNDYFLIGYTFDSTYE